MPAIFESQPLLQFFYNLKTTGQVNEGGIVCLDRVLEKPKKVIIFLLIIWLFDHIL
jgi:hypothetical protein